jgi:hypothetical protein
MNLVLGPQSTATPLQVISEKQMFGNQPTFGKSRNSDEFRPQRGSAPHIGGGQGSSN